MNDFNVSLQEETSNNMPVDKKTPNLLKYLLFLILSFLPIFAVFALGNIFQFFKNPIYTTTVLFLYIFPFYTLIYFFHINYDRARAKIWLKLPFIAFGITAVSTVIASIVGLVGSSIGISCVGGHGVGCAIVFLPFNIGVTLLIILTPASLILVLFRNLINRFETLNSFVKNNSNKIFWLCITFFLAVHVAYGYYTYTLYAKDPECWFEQTQLRGNGCLISNAIKTEGLGFCEKIEDARTRAECIYQVARIDKNSALCENISRDQHSKELCLYMINEEIKNPEFCDWAHDREIPPNIPALAREGCTVWFFNKFE